MNWPAPDVSWETGMMIILPLLLGLNLLTAAGLIWMAVKVRALLRRYRQMLVGPQEGNLEKILLEQAEGVRAALARVEEVEEAQRRLEEKSVRCLQRLGVVRYNAFQDTGSDLSFSVALLDANGDGVVVSSLYGREESRTYGKPVRNGESEYFLTAEEREAISRALTGRPAAASARSKGAVEKKSLAPSLPGRD